MDENNEKIKEIIDKINADAATSVSRTESGSIEFQFDAPMPKTGLVFEQTDDAEAPEPEIELTEEITAQTVSEDDATDAVEESSDDDGEFIIPDVFELGAQAEAAEQTPSDEYVSTIWKAYVPMFTTVFLSDTA